MLTMRILFVSNFYPPLGQGGYEEWCAEVAGRLRRDGHDVVVLTSRRTGDSTKEPAWIQRELHLEMPFISLVNGLLFFTRREREKENEAIIDRALTHFQPDAALIWGMWNLPRSVPAQLEQQLGPKVAYYIGDYWPTLPSQYVNYWNAPVQNRLLALPKRVLRQVAMRQLAGEPRAKLRLDHVMVPSSFVGEALRQAGLEPGTVKLIPGAIDTKPYLQPTASETSLVDTLGRPLTLLFVGRLDPTKGVETALHALRLFIAGDEAPDVRLLIAGTGSQAYAQELRTRAEQLGVARLVTWLGRQPKDALPALYRSADIFLFTSVWPEPFGRVIIEAMASGTAVVAATTGGAAEIVRDGHNGLTYQPGDASELANQINRLRLDPALRRRLARQGQQDAIDRWDLAEMADRIVAELAALAAGNS